MLRKIFLNKWSVGFLSKNITILPYKGFILYNLKKNKGLIKEINKIGLPIIALSNIEVELLQILYPVLSNNLNGSAVFYFSLILSNAILEGKLLKLF